MNTGILKTLAITTGVVLTAAALGLLAGELFAPKEGKQLREEIVRRIQESEAAAAQPIDRNAPPAYFLAGTPNDGDWSMIEEEMALAAGQGVRQFIVPMRLPWNGAMPDFDLLETALEIEPRAAFLLSLNYNPPESWLQTNIAAARTENGKPLVFPCLASHRWREAAVDVSATLYEALEYAGFADRILGVSLGALRGNRWRHPEGIDDNPANLEAFRQWLAVSYADVEALRAAWGDATVTFESAQLPAALPETDGNSFVELPREQAWADFTAFTSWQTADAIERLIEFWKTTAGPDWRVFAQYGQGLELTENTSGHGAMAPLLDGALDGFIGPISAADRGLGGVGALPGPVASARYHGKQWILVDDARTGLAKDPDTGRPERLKGLNRRDVFNVQRRNFAMALTQGMGIAWADPLGKGALCDETQWKELGAMRKMLDTTPNASPAPGLLVVYDEAVRHYVRNDARVHERLLRDTRDAVFRLGVDVQFCLLEDFLDGTSPQSPAYLFLNLFRLDTESREKLHARLAREQAAALWRYAPGYFGDTVSGVEAVSATVAMQAGVSDAEAKTGSKFALDGTWLDAGTLIGAQETWSPRFTIDDENADVLANYIDGGAPSVALRQLEPGWTSVFLAEPGITAALLREIFHILELPMHPVPSSPPHFDAVYAGRGYLAIHAAAPGERTFQLPAVSDVRDLFDPSAGWLNTDYFSLPLNMGETRLLAVSPTEP